VTDDNIFQHLGHRRKKQWMHLQRCGDYTLCLNACANWYLRREQRDPYTAVAGPHHPQLYNPDSRIFILYFPAFDGRMFSKAMPLSDYQDACWKDINGAWEERVRRMCRYVEQSPNQRCLIEGIFRHDEESTCMFVLVRLGYDESASEGRRYKVEESLWRPG
jgi:hypothetical protein